jgi:hypothetical protein
VVDYLREENRILREQLGERGLRLTDAQRRRLAVRDRRLGRKALSQVASIVTPETLKERIARGPRVIDAWGLPGFGRAGSSLIRTFSGAGVYDVLREFGRRRRSVDPGEDVDEGA